MFSTILAYGTFTVTTLTFLALIIEPLIPKSDAQKALQRLERYASGKTTVLDWRKILVLFVLWTASGIYIWG